VHFPNLPSIVVEWAALIPLTVYFSSFRNDYELAGEVSFRGRLSIGVVPKLWALEGVAELLSDGEIFFDTSSATGDPLKVYNVQWVSMFPCYNSAAAAAVATTAFNGKEYCPEISHDVTWLSGSEASTRTPEAIPGKQPRQWFKRRSQQRLL
jgi:hypothetical protein